MRLPDLSDYDLHRVIEDGTVRGAPVPGLRIAYFHRSRSGRTATAGVYAYRGVEIFVAWGYADERHCRYHAFRDRDGNWEPARPGCPRVRATPDGGLLMRTCSGERQLAFAGAAAPA